MSEKNNFKVLIIDDEIAMAKAIELKLKKNGVDAHAVFSGKDGLDELDSNEYNLALLDLMMPEVDGWEVLKKIKEKGLKTIVIITSNLSQQEDIAKAKDLGAVNFLVKSEMTLAGILDIVKSYI